MEWRSTSAARLVSCIDDSNVIVLLKNASLASSVYMMARLMESRICRLQRTSQKSGFPEYVLIVGRQRIIGNDVDVYFLFEITFQRYEIEMPAY